jgi:hypothetical protein
VLSTATLEAAQPVCDAFAAAVEPYLFGAGLQDLRGLAEGFLGARTGAAAGLVAAARGDAIDREKLRGLTDALHVGNRRLRRMDGAAAASAWDVAYAELRRYEAHAAGEADAAVRLGLGDCVTTAPADGPA